MFIEEQSTKRYRSNNRLIILTYTQQTILLFLSYHTYNNLRKLRRLFIQATELLLVAPASYPNTVSRPIITAKPMIKPNVASISCPILWLSGIMSRLTTKAIAPAAKASPLGRMGRAKAITDTPMSPPTGSTRPVKVAYYTAFFRLKPSLTKGKATAEPSGCSVIL